MYIPRGAIIYYINGNYFYGLFFFLYTQFSNNVFTAVYYITIIVSTIRVRFYFRVMDLSELDVQLSSLYAHFMYIIQM